MASDNNKRIAKNTVYLYFRMGIIMIVSLYTARIILDTLGVEDYGLYNVVGGVVVLFSFLNQSLSSTTQRYLAFELGKQNYSRLKDIFNASILIYGIIVLIVLFLAETVGLWFLNSKMNFPEDRLVAANWVYQFSILTTCVNILRAPFNANVIANEKMSFYAYTSIFEAILKLIILYILVIQPYDKLISYSVLIFFVTVLISFWYYKFNQMQFKYVQFKKVKEPGLFKELLGFSGWGVFGSFANVGFRQGINIVINIFFGVGVNAAFGIANSVSAMVNQFVNGFQTSLNPQLTKSHATGEVDNQNKLIYRSSKFSFFLILLIGLPVLLNTKFLLSLWLKTVPNYTIIFSQLMIIGAMIEAISAPLWVIIFATGKIRTYQIVISLVLLSNIPLSYIAAKFGFGPEYMLYIRIFVFIICIGIRLSFVYFLISFDVWKYTKKVLFPIVIITALVLPIPVFITKSITGYMGLFSSVVTSSIILFLVIYYFGLDKGEKEFVKGATANLRKRIKALNS